MITPAGQNSTSRKPVHLPRCNSATDKSSKKMKVQLQCISSHSLTAEMRLEALKAHGSEVLPRSRLPGNCCYATVESPNQSAACCSLRLNCTTMFQIFVRSAVYTQTIESTQEGREMHVNAATLPTPDLCSSRNDMKKAEWCVTLIIYPLWSLYCMLYSR